MRFLLPLLFFMPTLTWAQIYLTERDNEVWVSSHMDFYEDKQDTLTIQYIDKVAFKPMRTPLYSFGLSNSSYWLKITVENKSPFTDWLLTVDFAQHSYVSLYEMSEGGKWSVQKQGFLLPQKTRPIFHNFFVFPLNVSKANTTIYLNIKSDRPCTFPVSISRNKTFVANKSALDVYYGVYVGIFLALLIYNSLLWVGLRDITYFYYAVSILSSLMMNMANSGYVSQYIFPNYPLFGRYTIEVASAFLTASGALFARSFLDIRKHSIWLDNILLGIAGVGLLSFFGLFILPITVSMLVLYNALSILVLILLASGFVSWQNKNRFAGYYIIAWLGYLVGGIFRLWADQAIIPWNIVTHHGTEVGSAMEVMLLSLALSSRYNAYRKEKENAIKHALEVEKEANETLEKKVNERTLQLKEANEEMNQINEELSTTLELVEMERQKSDKLLLNVMPSDVAQELKEVGHYKPKFYELATVLFTDFKGFTNITEKISPQQVIEQLNICFLAFDEICEKYGMEKIKTIGDSYMCAGGLPIPNTTNPVDAVKAGLEMQKWMEGWIEQKKAKGEPVWEIRIGIHTGELIAGVVGKNKFAYDIWGDTVNTASRMESSGEAGKVNISETTYNLIKDEFVCTYRGAIQAKNKGEINMYFVTR